MQSWNSNKNDLRLWIMLILNVKEKVFQSKKITDKTVLMYKDMNKGQTSIEIHLHHTKLTHPVSF